MSAGPATFGALVRRYRQAAVLSQEGLAERAGLSVDAISVIERGKRGAPRPGTVALLAHALDLSPTLRADFVAAARTVSVPPETLAAPAHASPLTFPPLPTALTAFVGREREVAAIRARLLESGTRLLTLMGPAGVGKTRLALEVAALVRDDGAFPDGVAFVPLAALTDVALALPTIAHVLGLGEVPSQTPVQTLATTLADGRVLLVLDNLEQILGVAPDLGELLATAVLADKSVRTASHVIQRLDHHLTRAMRARRSQRSAPGNAATVHWLHESADGIVPPRRCITIRSCRRDKGSEQQAPLTALASSARCADD